MAEARTDPAGQAAPNTTGSMTSAENRTDPSRDGLVGLYALRILDRGVDPRTLVAAHRATRYGLTGRPSRPIAAEQSRAITAIGRGAAPSLPGQPAPAQARQATTVRRRKGRRLALPSVSGLAALLDGPQPTPARNPRRLVAAGVVVAAMLGLGAVGAFAQEQPSPPRDAAQAGYRVVAAESNDGPQ